MRWMVLVLLGFLLSSQAVSAQKAGETSQLRYRWVDGAGQVHLADEIPADAVKYGYDLVNHYGRVVRHVDGARTAEQLAADKARRAAEKRAAEQARADQQLVISYSSEAELAAAQNEHLTMLSKRIDATEINMKSQLDGLANLLDQAAAHKQRGETVPAYVEQEIAKQQNVIREQRDWLGRARKELDDARVDAADELARYRALRGGQHPAKPASSP